MDHSNGTWNIAKLKARLDRRGVSSGSYCLRAARERYGRGDSGTGVSLLTQDELGWRVTYVERGVEQSCERFDGEDEACQYLYARLTYEPQRKVVLSDAEWQRAAVLQAQHMREYETWLHSVTGKSSDEIMADYRQGLEQGREHVTGTLSRDGAWDVLTVWAKDNDMSESINPVGWTEAKTTIGWVFTPPGQVTRIYVVWSGGVRVVHPNHESLAAVIDDIAQTSSGSPAA